MGIVKAQSIVRSQSTWSARVVGFGARTDVVKALFPMLHIVALLAELERGLIVERTKAGQHAARRRALKSSGKPKLSPDQVDHIRQLITRDGKAPTEAAALPNVSRVPLWRGGGRQNPY